MHLFDVVNEELFKPLAGINKHRYSDILSLLWDSCRRKPLYAVPKGEMTDLVEAYLAGVGETVTDDGDEDDDEVIAANDYRSYATHFLRRLRAAGWLIEREGEYEEESRLALNHHTIPLLKSFAEIINPKIITYKGRLFELYTMLSHIQEFDNPYETCLKEAEERLMDLTQSLHDLAASIEEHIDFLTQGKTPEEILAFFEEYEERIVVGSYQRFKTNDNLFYYRNSLYDVLDICEDSLLDVLIRDYEDTEHASETEARSAIFTIIRSMRDSLNSMEEIMRVIDERHILYRTRAVQRAQFLLLSDGSIKSKINGLLKYYAAGITCKAELSEIDETPVNRVFQVYGQNYFEAASLATPYKRKKPTPITAMTMVEELDLEFIEKQQQALIEYARTALTSDNVNRYASELLSGQSSVSASYALEQDPSAIVKLIGLYTYSVSTNRTYNVQLKDNMVSIGGIRFRDFVIERN